MILLDKGSPDGIDVRHSVYRHHILHGGSMDRKKIPGYTFGRLIQLCHLWLVLLLVTPAVTFGQRLILTPSLSVGERYDDNIFQEEDDEDDVIEEERKEDDFVTVITPGITLLYTPTAMTRIDFTYFPSFEFFADHSDQNQVAHRLLFRLRSPLTRRLSLNVNERLVVTDEPQDRDSVRLEDPPVDDDIEEPVDGGTRDESHSRRERTIRNFANATLDVQLAARLSLGLLFRSLIEDVDVADEVDEFRYGGGAELGYLTNIARGNRVSVAYNVTFFTFRSNGLEDAEDFQVQTVDVGYLHNFSPTLTAEARFGYAFTTSDDDALDGNADFVGSLDITKKLQTGAISFRYERGFTSGRGQGDAVLADRFFVTFLSRISPKITARLQGDVSLLDFQENNNEDRLFFAIRPSLIYEALRFWRLSLAYDFEFSNFDESDRADRTNHRLTFISQFILRRGLSLDLTYRFRARRFGDGVQGDSEFDRNEVMLSITYAPTLRFF